MGQTAEKQFDYFPDVFLRFNRRETAVKVKNRDGENSLPTLDKEETKQILTRQRQFPRKSG
jgi:hypothetical protein